MFRALQRIQWATLGLFSFFFTLIKRNSIHVSFFGASGKLNLTESWQAVHCAATSAECSDCPMEPQSAAARQTDIHRRGAKKRWGLLLWWYVGGLFKRGVLCRWRGGGGRRGVRRFFFQLFFLFKSLWRLEDSWIPSASPSPPGWIYLVAEFLIYMRGEKNERLINYSSNSCIMHLPRHLVATSKLSDVDLGRRGGQYWPWCRILTAHQRHP